MKEITLSVPQKDRTTMARTFNLAFLLGHPIHCHESLHLYAPVCLLLLFSSTSSGI